VDKVGIPYLGKVTGLYYGRKHGRQMKDAIWRMATAR
jgi:hypothetical protein